jgi:hypothetical protein
MFVLARVGFALIGLGLVKGKTNTPLSILGWVLLIVGIAAVLLLGSFLAYPPL